MKDIPTNKQFTGWNKMDILNKTIHSRESRGAVVKLLLNFLTQCIIYSALITSF